MYKLLQIAWRNMWRNWRRTLIATVAIVLGLILLISMDALIKGSDQAIFGNAIRLYGGNIQIHAPGYRAQASHLPLIPLPNPERVLQAARKQPQVQAASLRIQTPGLVSKRGASFPVGIIAIQPEQELATSLIAENISQGRFLDANDEDAILIGKGLADFLDVELGDSVTLLGKRKDESLRQRRMTVIGIYSLGLAEAEKGMVYINLPTAQTLYNLRDQVTEVTIILEDIEQEASTISALQSALPNLEVDSWKTLKPEMQQTLALKSSFTTIFGIIVLLIASIGILNLMLMAVYERTREMGVLAALGLKNRQIMLLFLLEGTLIGAFGALVGCGLGWLVMLALGRVGLDFSFASSMGEMAALLGTVIYPKVSLISIIKYWLDVCLIAALASLYPAWQAARRQPSESLHYI